MKKWLVGLCLFIVLVVGSIYFFIPSKLSVSAITPASSTFNTAIAFSSNSKVWYKWWPGTLSEKDTNCNNCVATYKDVQYRIISMSYNNTKLQLVHKNDTTIVSLAVAEFVHDSIKIITQFNFNGSINPIKRIQQYNEAAYIKQNIHEVIKSLKLFMENPVNIYGFTIKSTMVKDTVLMSTKSIFTHQPSTTEIYTLINQIRKYIKQTGGIETNPPMLNVTKYDDMTFKTTVAIPVNHTLPTTDKIALKRMVVGRILQSDSIIGGSTTVSTSFKMFEKYFADFKHTSPAIPFQLLVSDRDKTDSSKWVTRFYYPIF